MRSISFLVQVTLLLCVQGLSAAGGAAPRYTSTIYPITNDTTFGEPAGPITRFIVLLRNSEESSHISGQLSDNIVRSLAATVGTGLHYVGPHNSGGQILEVPLPIGLTDARRLLGLLRMRSDVIWAELDRAQLESQSTMAKRSETLSRAAGTTQLMVTLSDPETQRLSRSNGALSGQWDALLSQIAGVPLKILRPAVGSAWIVGLPQSMSYTDAAAIGDALTASGIARYADPDAPVDATFVPNDPLFLQGGQWGLSDPFSSPYAGIDAGHAWDITTGDPNMVIAVVDTGVLPHPEIASRLLPGYDFVSNPSNSHDGLGPHASGVDPGNWHSATDCPGKAAANSNWHGTHVSGIIAATGNNGSGIAGINWRSKILPVRVLGTCGGTTSDILTGMLWAAGLSVPGFPINPTPAKVINMSLGGPGTCTPQYQALVNLVLAAGALIVASAGNDDGIADNQIPGACFGLSTVGASGPYADRAPYSNFSFTLDISAPGGDSTFGIGGEILSTLNAGTTTPAAYVYKQYQGTSQAAPHVTGVASLMFAVNPSLTPAQVKQIMVDTATGFASTSLCNIAICGAGIVNAYRSVLVAQALAGGPNPTTTVAVEYYYADWNFYFVTSLQSEIAALDGGAFGGLWKRTGQTFNVWSQPVAMSSPTCRFFSTPAAFVGKSSHFYTPFPAECQDLQTNPALSAVWQLETEAAFYVALTDANGNCSVPGTVPLYRAYDNGLGGAPNHRYTTDQGIQASMIAMGWTAEGNGPNVIFACVPQ